MNKTVLINAALLIAIAAAGYVLTGITEHTKPHIIVQPDAPVELIQPGKPLPDFSFTTPDKTTHTITDFKNKIVVLNFWASWCPPCIKEFPNFIKLAEAYPDDVVFIALSSDIDEPAMNAFLKKTGLQAQPKNILIALDTQDLTKSLFQTYKLPETILADRNLVMNTKIIGADWEYEDLASRIETLRTR